MKYILLILFVTFSTKALSQKDSLDVFSKDQLYEKAETQNKTLYLDELYTRNLTNSELLDYYEKYIRLSYQIGDYQKSKSKSLELLKFSQKEKNTHYELVATLSLLEVEFVFQNFENSKKYYLLTKSIVKKLPESTDKFVAGMDADFFYYLHGDFDKYCLVMESNINNLKKQDTKKLNKEDAEYVQYVTAGSLLYLADAYVMLQDFKNANLRLSEAEKILKEQFPDEAFTFCMKAKIVKGKLLLFQKKFKESISVFEKNLFVAEKYNFDDIVYQSRIFLAMNYFNVKDYQKSLFYAESAIKSSEKVADFIDFNLEAKRYAFLASKKLNLNEKSIHYADLYINESNEIKIKKRRDFINQIIENDSVKEIQDEKSKFTKYLIAIIVFSVFSLMFLYFYSRKKRKKMLSHYQNIIDQYNIKKDDAKKSNTRIEKGDMLTVLDEKTKDILAQLKKFEQGKMHLKPNVSLAFLASHLNTNVNFLSSIINQFKNQNFNDYINGLRIDYIIERLQNDHKYRNYKISYLAEECRCYF